MNTTNKNNTCCVLLSVICVAVLALWSSRLCDSVRAHRIYENRRLRILLASCMRKWYGVAAVHRTAKGGFKDGSHYDNSRPNYNTEIVTHVANRLHKNSTKDVKYSILELGAGTGLFTRKVLSVLPKRILLASCMSKWYGVAAVHRTAKGGFKDGSHYDNSRPNYNTEIVTHVANRLHKNSTKDVKYSILELGAGTGLFTRKVLSVLPKDIKYLATDPSEEFLSTLKRQSPDIETKQVIASRIPLPDASVENIFCAQCFHWFATEENLKEMIRVLVPSGRIMFMFYDYKRDSVDWIDRMDEILNEYYNDDTPRVRLSGKWMELVEAFKPLKFVEHNFMAGNPDLTGDKLFIIDVFKSVSVIAQLGGEEKIAAVAKFRAVLDASYTDDQQITMFLQSEFYCVEKN